MPQPKTISLAAPLEIQASQADKTGPRTFNVQAYNGGLLELKDFPAPVVVDLAGVTAARSIVANLHHDGKQIVGHVTDTQNDGKQLRMIGLVSGAGPAASEVLASHDNGFPWQASIEANRLKLKQIPAGQSVSVNGRTFTGPLLVAQKSRVYGVGFLPHGADENTSVSIAAGAASSRGSKMEPDLKSWIEDMLPGIEIETLSAEQVAGLKANFNGRNARKKTPAKLDDIVATAKANRDRMARIEELAAEAIDKNPADLELIQAMATTAIDAETDVETFALELLRGTRPQAHSVFRSRRDDNRMNNQVIEAAVCMAGGLETLDKRFNDQTLQAAQDHFPNGIGLKQIMLLAARDNGYRDNFSGEVTLDVQRAAFGMFEGRSIKAEFSTLSLPGILSNTANKFLLEGFMAVDSTCRRISGTRSVRDFKTVTSYSLTGDFEYQEVGPTGEIKHGSPGELSYTNKAATYGRMLGITRADIINDDLGALTTAPRRLGRGAALSMNTKFWTKFLDNTTFFTAARGNFDDGADSALDLAGLEAADVLFMDQTDPDGKPLGAMPAILLVPTALKATALQLMTSEKIKGDADAPDGNVWRGRFRVESSPYMSNTSFTGNSALKWYLLANPAELAVIEICYLNGRETPVVETAQPAANVLGATLVAYHDFGVELQEYRGGVAMKGEA